MRAPVRIAALLLAAAGAAAAMEPMNPADFAAFAEGKTLYFERDGAPAGAEQFFGDGRVLWQYPSGECLDGVWRAHRGLACFYYGPGTELLCWSMTRESDGAVTARLEEGGAVEGLELRITGRDERPLLCSGDAVAT